MGGGTCLILNFDFVELASSVLTQIPDSIDGL